MAKRKAALCANLTGRYGFPYVTFEVRGPLTIAQVEQEVLAETSKFARVDILPEPFGFEAARWRQVKDQYTTGDEFYFFTSDECSWSNLCGVRGYILARECDIVDSIVTRIN